MKYIIFFLLNCTFLGFFYGCIENNTPTKTYTIGFSQCCHDAWRDVMNTEMKRESAFHSDIKLEFRDSYNNSDKQIEQIRELIKMKVDVLVVSPNESQPLTKVIDEVYKSGIPVVLVDRKTDSELYTAYVGADNYEIGRTAAKYLATQFPKQGNIIELKLQMTMSPAVERSRGFRDAVKEYPNLRIVESLEAEKGLADVYNHLPDVLKKHSEANIVFGHADILAEAAYKAAKEQGRAKDVFFLGIDGLPINSSGFQGVMSGTMNASLLYPPGGTEAMQTAIKIIMKQAFDKENKLLTTVINADNAPILLAQFKKLEEQQKDIDRQTVKIQDLNKTYSSQRNRLYLMSTLLAVVIFFGTILFYLFKEKQQSNKILSEQNQAILEQKNEILEQKNEIEKVSLIAQQATEEKLRFYSYISHEFRTPLSLILTPTEDLLNQKTFDSRDTRFSLQFIRKNANRLLRLVDQFLELRKIDAGKMVLEAQQHDLVAFTKDIVRDFTLKAKNQNIDLQFICPFETLPFWFDAEKLDKVLFNIISNAFKYTPRDGSIHVMLIKNVDKIEITLADSGAGMTAEEREHAFNLFYRGNQKVSLGTGLGLALSQEFVQLHDGTIIVSSEKNKGTTFKIILPFIEPKTRVSNAKKTSETYFNHLIETDENELPKQTKGTAQYLETTIILIEDNPDLNLFLKRKLEKTYHFITTETAEKGFELILEHIPDVIISDVMLPKMDGYALTQKVKNDFRTSHIPVILLTAKGQIENQIEGTKAGADVYMTKPFNQQLLEERIKGLIENSDRMRRRFTNEITRTSQVPKNERKFLVEFETLIEKNMKNSTLSVEKLSHELGMSRVQLFRKISALTGKNVLDYITEFKLQRAKILLKESDKTIAEIAYELGFNTPSYFTTFFKQKTNQTPRDWRNA